MTSRISQTSVNKLVFGCLNVCGLKSRLQYPEFSDTLSHYDIFCVTETKLDYTDVISMPGYTFLSQERKQTFIRKSGGIGIFFRNNLESKIKRIETASDYIFWLRMDKALFNIHEDLILGILYIPPAQSRFLNDDEYSNLEMEITSMCIQSPYICLTGDMNARSSNLCDFITADSTIADLMNFDQETLSFFNQVEELVKLNVNRERISQDKSTNNNGYRLIDICISNNLFLLNGRFGKDSKVGKCTFRNQSLIDYTICSIDCMRLLLDFEVIDTDALYSDGHSILKWSSKITHDDTSEKSEPRQQKQKTYKNRDPKLTENFVNAIPNDFIDNLYFALEPSKDSIDFVTNSLSKMMIDTAKTTFPSKSFKTNSSKDKPWFGPKCRLARSNYYKAKHHYRSNRTSQNYLRLQHFSKTYKNVMNFYISKQKHEKANYLRDLHSSKPKDYWQYLNTLKRRSQTSAPTLQHFYEYFKDVNMSNDRSNFDFNESNFNINNADIILNSSITGQEISSAMKGLKSGKAAGFDEILNEYIKATETMLMPLYIKRHIRHRLAA